MTTTTTTPTLFNYVFYHINRDWSVGRSVGRLLSQSVSQLASRPAGQPVGRSVRPSVSLFVCLSAFRSLPHSLSRRNATMSDGDTRPDCYRGGRQVEARGGEGRTGQGVRGAQSRIEGLLHCFMGNPSASGEHTSLTANPIRAVQVVALLTFSKMLLPTRCETGLKLQ